MNPNFLFRGRRHAAVALLASLTLASGIFASAATITGTVTNGTTHKVSAGDPVVLIGLTQRMQELTRTTTDARGHFSLNSPDPGGMHLVRVDHQKAAYFQPVPPNSSHVNVEVYDVAETVAGVNTEANVMRVETDRQDLRVTQILFVKNDSNPPRTQFSNHSYEIYLPGNAQIEGSAAMGPGGMPVQSSPVPLGDKGHYAFIFPLRPGESRFQLSYRLPYSGSLTFTPRLATAAANFVVMLPKSMKFRAGSGASFQSVDEPSGAQTFLARDVTPSQSLAFTVSGSGAMPRDTQTAGNQSDANPSAAGESSASTDTRPGGGLGVPIDTPDPLSKYKWWILGGIALIFAIAAGFLLRRPVAVPDPANSLAAPNPAPANSENILLTALKDELFAIETDRMQGKLSDSEYGELKSAFELVLRRALSRQPA